jgi:hypothetical protein
LLVFFAAFAAISEALNYRSFLEDLSTSGVSTETLFALLSRRLLCSAEPRILYQFFASGQIEAIFLPPPLLPVCVSP